MKQLFLILLTALLLPCNVKAQTTQKQYQPTWESLATRPYPQWFKDAKLGIFIHWSLSSVPAWSGKEQYGEWFLRGLLVGDTARINFQKRVFGENWKYEDYAPLFKGELFDAAEWADLFKRAGAKYVLLVSKHHDGYCLWPSKYAKGWNTMDVGPHRDIVGELSSAVRNSGMKMGLYYSLPEWNNKLYRWGTDKPEMVKQYVDQHMIPQFKELVSTYKPSMIFSDGEWDHPASTWHSAELISWYYNLVGDDAIVNNRWGDGSQAIGFQTPEYSAGIAKNTRPWAEARGLGRSFGLNRNESLEAYLSPQDLVHFFVKAVANGGGMTLNVGPYCDGQIPLLQQERLLQLGEWLNVNGEAIYGSTMHSKSIELKDVTLTRTDNNINFDWVRNSPGKPIVEDNFSASWQGFIKPLYSEKYTFEAKADDGIRVWIDGKLVIDNWVNETTGTQSNVMEAAKGNSVAGGIELTAGKTYTIRIEYIEKDLNAHAYLYWSSTSQNKEVIPASAFFTTQNEATHGLNATYKSKAIRVCYTVNNRNLYAIMLDWPTDNKLKLQIEKPSSESKISMLGRKGNLPWKYENGNVIVDLNKIKITELPCQWAWTFKITK